MKIDVPLLIGIELPSRLDKEIDRLRAILRTVARCEYREYGMGEPCIPLFVNTFSGLASVDERLNSLTQRFSPFTIQIEGIDLLSLNQSPRHSIVALKVRRTSTLSDIQAAIVEQMNPIRTGAQARWMMRTGLTRKQRDNLKIYGHPAGPEDWVFHVPIAHIEKHDEPAIRRHLRQQNFRAASRVSAVSVFVHLGGDGFNALKKYKLGYVRSPA
jgi:hypothetical protein